jgi:tRNA modification GTPase
MSAASSAFSTDDTIVAIATPPGRGAIGIARLSGPEARQIASLLLHTSTPLKPRYATLTRVRGHGTWPGDEVLATYFKAPYSYTGEDLVELSAHGSPVVLQQIVDAACRHGSRLARPGEFTLRAYLNGKRDLVQAEAVADLIDAVTPLQAAVAFDQLQGTLTSRIREIDSVLFALIARLEASLDFADEGYHFVDPHLDGAELAGVISKIESLLADGRRGRMIRDGATVVLAGRPNVGKSLLFNCLNGSSRAIVTAVPGTTRDLLTETVDVNGLAVFLVDTAGVRSSEDLVEAEGVRRANGARAVADLVVLVLDRSEPLADDDHRLLAEQSHRLVVANKSDKPPAFDLLPNEEPFILVSARTGEGIDAIRDAIAQHLSGEGELLKERVTVSNARHFLLLEQALEHLRRAHDALEHRTPEEFVLTDLQTARSKFDELVGTRTSDDVLRHIFDRFCIGK